MGTERVVSGGRHSTAKQSQGGSAESLALVLEQELDGRGGEAGFIDSGKQRTFNWRI